MKVIKLFNKKSGLVDEVLLGYASSESEIKDEWYESFGFSNPIRRDNFYTIVGDDGLINPFTAPQKLKKCKYDLISSQVRIKSIVTEKYNRELILKDLIKLAKETSTQDRVAFKIYLTEDGIKSVLIDSKEDKNFIKFLYEKNERCEH